ncbi:hypothetical protein [Aurantimicrobium minutum]|uniref:RCC1 domain-containing protein n=1 Tax=Aurantimicrobium minutum TaxID=708131 RepID=UPI0024748CC3|nr:hypothetical protein [Aurantimicrobium minutum]
MKIKDLSIAALSAFLLSLGMVLPAQAVVTPTSGPASGGTVATIDGIKFVQIATSVGGEHHLGLTSEGTVYSWGMNTYGALGNGTQSNSSIPVQVKGVGGSGFLTGIKYVAASSYSSYAISISGEVFAWGDNQYGELGDGAPVYQPQPVFSTTPVQVLGVGGSGSLTNIVEISGGGNHVIALNSSGDVFTWGQSMVGQLGNGTYADTSLPVQPTGVGGGGPLTGIVHVTAGWQHSLAITQSKTVLAWGANSYGQLGINQPLGFTPTPEYVVGVGGTGLLSNITAVSASLHSMALSSSGEVYAWGANWGGQLGDGTIFSSQAPVQTRDIGGTGVLSGITAIQAGVQQGYAITTAGELLSWGPNINGETGNGLPPAGSLVPDYVSGIGGTGHLTGVSSVGTTYDSASAVLTNGDIVSWGANQYGQLGNGVNGGSPLPAMGPNFRPTSIAFDGTPGTSLSASGSSWNVTTPAHAAATVNVVGTADLYGGLVIAGAPVSWTAGTFEYLAAASAPVSSPTPTPSASTSASPTPSQSASSNTASSSTPLAYTGSSFVPLAVLAASAVLVGLVFLIRRRSSK